MKIYKQNVFERWPIDDESVNSIITSPPYYNLRRYQIPNVIMGGSKDCSHEWTNHRRKPSGGSGEKANVGGNQDAFSNLLGWRLSI